MKAVFGLAVVLFTLLPAAQAQMIYRISVFTDLTFSSDFSSAFGYSSTIDQSSGCNHSNYGTTTFIYSPDGRNNSGAGGMYADVGLMTNGYLGTYFAGGVVQLNCSCMPVPVQAGGAQSARTVDESGGCKLSFAPGMWTGSCKGTLNDSIWNITTSPTTASSCTITQLGCSLASSDGAVSFPTDPVTCNATLQDRVSGHVRYYAGNTPPDIVGTTVGSIAVSTTFKLNGVTTNYGSQSKSVVCK